MTASPQTILLSEYKAPNFEIVAFELDFSIYEGFTRVSSRIDIKSSEHDQAIGSLRLDGLELELESIRVDGNRLRADQYTRQANELVIERLGFAATIEIVTKIYPEANTALEGLYKSSVMYCTQCEAEGFRRITYFPDRPDVLTKYRVRIEADKATCPVLLSNGNNVASGDLANGRHYSVWEDPHKKPCYLFALVAGDLERVSSQFITASGVTVDLHIYVEAKDIDKCDFAMDALKRSMKWDEDAYGREYDLNIFNIVAVDDFNMGAMENKSLNIFNTSCVLGRQDTTTDASFQRIEGIVGHEYFHNWSGNRVTCRDWFQLSLKEGFTVFRDAQFSAEMGSPAIKRIEDVALLRSRQFAEDAGPLAHAVRPASYIEISNFYTLTVYEKGAEVVGMIHRLLGERLFRKGSDLYFDRNDGKAATIEDFVSAMSEVSGRDFSQFMNWYSQAGTPKVTVQASYDEQAQRYSIELSQHCRPTAECQVKQPYVIPVTLSLLGEAGALPLSLCGPEVEDNTEITIEFTASSQVYTFENVAEKPVLSIFRSLSAPVNIEFERPRSDLLFLIANDDDPVNAWDASQQLLTEEIHRAMVDIKSYAVDVELVDAFRRMLESENKEPALKAYMLQLPSEAMLHQGTNIDPLAIFNAREAVFKSLATQLRDTASDMYHALPVFSRYCVDSHQVGVRLLKNTLLSLVAPFNEGLEMASEQYGMADNMTEELAALQLLQRWGTNPPTEDYYNRWKDDSLVLNSWFSVMSSYGEKASLSVIVKLLEHSDFDFNNPNKVRSLLGAFCSSNTPIFHAQDGSGYEFLGDMVLKLDSANPQLASRIAAPLTRWQSLSSPYREHMKAVLNRINNSEDLSKDLFEVVSKSLFNDA